MLAFCTAPVSAQVDSLLSNVYHWNSLEVEKKETSERRQILEGSTTDLEYLEIHATTLLPRKAPHSSHSHEDEEMIIVKEGRLSVTIGSETRVLGPGSIAVAMSGDEHGWQNAVDTPATYYVFRYRSKTPKNVERSKEAGGSFMVDWEDLEFKPSDIGGRRQNFDRATSMFERFEMHTSTLNEALTNHKKHTHRAEEFVLILKGEVEMPVGESNFKAARGDLIFLASGIPHALNNIGKGQAEYFAFQWQ